MLKLFAILTVFAGIVGQNDVIAAPPAEAQAPNTANVESASANADDLNGEETFGYGFYPSPPFYGYGGGYYVPRPAPIGIAAGGYGYGSFGYGYGSRWGYRHRPIYPVWG